MSCPAYIAKISLRKWHLYCSQTTYSTLHYSGFQIVGNLRVIDQGCRVDGVILSNQICDGFPGLKTCVWPGIFTLKQDCCLILVRPICLKHFLSSVSVLMQASDLIISPLYITFTRITPSQFQKTVDHYFARWWRLWIFYFWGDCGWCRSTDCLFRVLFKMKDPGFICYDNLR
jgi:hypothetical protein